MHALTKTASPETLYPGCSVMVPDADIPLGGLEPPFETFTREKCSAAAGASVDLVIQSAAQLLVRPIDDAIRSTLTLLGEHSLADRAWMFEYDSRGLFIHNTHEWTCGEATPHVEDLQGMSIAMIGWLHRSLIEGLAVMINDVDRLPRIARRMQVEMQRQKDLSVLCVPVFHDGRLRACIGFDATQRHRRWDEVTIGTLFHCAELISVARYRGSEREEYLQKTKPDRPSHAPIIHLQVRNGTRGVSVDSILGVRSSHSYTEVWCADGSVIVDHRPIHVWFRMLPAMDFIQIHRTAAIHLSHVERLDRKAGRTGSGWNAYLRGEDKPWSVSRPYRQALRTKLGV